MNNAEIVVSVAKRLHITQKEAAHLVKSTTITIREKLRNNIGFTIPGLGTFSTHVREKRKVYIPHHSKHMFLPPKQVVSFHAATKLKDEIKDLEEGNG